MKNAKHILMSILAAVMILSFLPISHAESQDLPQVKEDKGLIIFYRASAFKGGAIRFNLNHGQEPIGALKSGTTLHRYVEPGQHTFWSKVISQDSVTLDVVAGKTYYIKGDVQLGLVAGRPRLTVVPESEAKAAIAKLK
jgi:hypothetical protein